MLVYTSEAQNKNRPIVLTAYSYGAEISASFYFTAAEAIRNGTDLIREGEKINAEKIAEESAQRVLESAQRVFVAVAPMLFGMTAHG